MPHNQSKAPTDHISYDCD